MAGLSGARRGDVGQTAPTLESLLPHAGTQTAAPIIMARARKEGANRAPGGVANRTGRRVAIARLSFALRFLGEILRPFVGSNLEGFRKVDQSPRHRKRETP